MANVEGVPSPNWHTYSVPPRTLDATRTAESGSGGKLDNGTPAAARARVKPPANRQTR